VRDHRENDADDNANQRDDISDANDHAEKCLSKAGNQCPASSTKRRYAVPWASVFADAAAFASGNAFAAEPSLDVGQIFYCETFGLPLLSSPGVVAVADALPSSTLVPLVVSGVGIGLPLLSAPGVPMVAPGSDWALGAVVSAAYATPIVKAR